MYSNKDENVPFDNHAFHSNRLRRASRCVHYAYTHYSLPGRGMAFLVFVCYCLLLYIVVVERSICGNCCTNEVVVLVVAIVSSSSSCCCSSINGL
jgi:hypothetical protein